MPESKKESETEEPKMIVKTINIPIYLQKLIFTAGGNVHTFSEFIKKRFGSEVTSEIIDGLKRSIAGFSGRIGNDECFNYVMWIEKYDNNDPMDQYVIAHEISHHVYQMFDDLGMYRTDASDEAYAYYTGWLHCEIVKILNREAVKND